MQKQQVYKKLFAETGFFKSNDQKYICLDCGNKEKGNKNLEVKKFIIIVFLIISIPSIIFIADDNRRSKYENPFKVGKVFSYYHMTISPEDMKLYADKKIYGKIDGLLQYSAPLIYEINYWDDFKLVCSRKIRNNIVCTYAYSDYLDPPFFYSVVLKPIGSISLWERVKDIIYFEIPFGYKFVNFYHRKQRWLVVDFFTNDDFENYYVTSRKKDTELLKSGEFMQVLKNNIKQIDLNARQIQSYADKWSEGEMIRQNEEMKKLYKDSLKGLNNNNE